ncbi:hypothetical protein M405DRAFT_29121 [Rhizopogon salebrosus TDB-379]|nr:hypothetical protein M405DRAFT_29121 [Rhizopogon salebrosus TDB-379]
MRDLISNGLLVVEGRVRHPQLVLITISSITSFRFPKTSASPRSSDSPAPASLLTSPTCTLSSSFPPDAGSDATSCPSLSSTTIACPPGSPPMVSSGVVRFGGTVRPEY